MRVKHLLQVILLFSTVIFSLSSCFHEDNKINATCFDEILNQDEEFIDCGGPNCDECPPACDNGIFDNVEGWQEWGVDCGGPCPSCCDNGVWDNMNPDVTKNEDWIDCGGADPLCEPCELCSNGMHDEGEVFMDPITGMEVDAIDCDNDPTTECPPCNELCNDGLYNGLETLCADCGGVCPACDDSQCSNQVLDEYPEPTTSTQSETAIDCGGCLCVPCEDPILCDDGYISGYEEAIDCGGGVCEPCNSPNLCSDGELNGYETEVDCYDGEDGLSACPPCSSTCDNNQYDGLETDLDCGGAFCPPCWIEESNFINYTVSTTDSPTSQLYESQFTSCNGIFGKGTLPTGNPPMGGTRDSITWGGGISHQIAFILRDDDDAPLNWGLQGDPVVFNFLDVTAQLPNNVIFVDDDGIQYESRLNGTGVTLTNLDVDIQAFGAVDFELTVTGNFSGTLQAVTGELATITNGVIQVTWMQQIP